ncbi:SDR family NAD(P)-dependent oxidoreductase [Mucilaginibacter lappiensis]|uniref:SDR family NAD(P)-dependent oxidoreductase n=1 Tax=Mucilaginibacter lappiensis TaxID=354630 RepID=UPI003D1B4948
MKKQTIIITGGSSYIGKEIVRRFLQNGDNVVLHLSANENLKDIYLQLDAAENLALVGGKVNDRLTGVKLLANAIGRFGSADVLVNNSGDLESKPFFNVDEVYLNQVLDTGFKGAFFAIQAIIPQMLKQGHGIVINIDAPLISHSPGTELNSNLLLPKGIMHSLTLLLGAEFGNKNIQFNTITPGKRSDRDIGKEYSDGVNELELIAQMVYNIAKGNINS